MDNNNTGQKAAAIHLNDAINVKTHDQLGDIAHQIVEPVVDTCQNVDWFIVVPEKHRERGEEGFIIIIKRMYYLYSSAHRIKT